MLFEKAKNGDIDSFEKLILEYEKLYFNIAYRILNDIEDAKDATQTGLIKIYKNFGKCASHNVFKAWSCKIITNTSIDYLRHKKRHYTEPLDKGTEYGGVTINTELKSDSPTPEETLINKERAQLIMDSVNMLDTKYKTVIILRDLNGFSYEEIAQITGQPVGTVKSRISRARNNLKKLLEGRLEHKNIKNV
ncbi:MAG: sigma-70 family RNA polymerase sigma factor [Clostridiales bacterium]|jgi:RNA polymerase sigma-70 factor (ECF subfamily)|nr:sigma-70 family RNA polymerase sigma factor [Clostridiales bacterium]